MSPAGRTLAFLDTETTGFDRSRHELLSIGVVVRSPDGRREEREWFLEPRHFETADPRSLEVIGYGDRIAGQETTSHRAALAQLVRLTGGATLVAANTWFDLGFLAQAMEEVGLEPAWVDTADVVEIAARRGIVTGPPGAFDQVCAALAVDTAGRHGALADARMVELVYDRLTGG